MWGGQDESDALAAVRAALEEGITTFDTAAVYGFGRSEEFIAKALGDVRRSDVQILTKYGLRWDIDKGIDRWQTVDNEGRPVTVKKYAAAESVIWECEQSLRRLGTDYIDLYQCHWRDESTPVEETMAAIDQLLRQGKIRFAGLSNFSVADIEAARKVVPIASDQPPYSMVNRGIEKDVLPYCRERGIGLLVYSPLQRGLLTGKIADDYVFGEGDHRAGNAFFRPDNRRKINSFLNRIRPTATAHRATLSQLVIAWTIAQPGITAALVGARNPAQAKENAAAAALKLTDGEVAEIDSLLEDLHLDLD